MIKRHITGALVLQNILTLLGLNPASFSLLVAKDRSSLSRYLKGEVAVPNDVLQKSLNLLSNAGIDPLDALGIPEEKEFYYHAASAPLTGAIDVHRNQGAHNDFGPGFYLGESLLQSASYQREGTPSLYLYRFKKSRFKALRIYDFDDVPVLDWFLYIAINRGKIDARRYGELIARFQAALAPFDALRGKIADSFTYQIIEGLFADIYDLDQAEACSVILALGDQLCLKNAAFAQSLEPDELWILEANVAAYFAAYGSERRARHDEATTAVLAHPYDPQRLFSKVLEQRYGKK
jgi:hypothetical protein